MTSEPSTPRDCPKCGRPMAAGFVTLSDRPLAWGTVIGWVGESPGPPATQNNEENAFERLHYRKYHGLSPETPRFPSWRCADCKIVEFAYGEEASRP